MVSMLREWWVYLETHTVRENDTYLPLLASSSGLMKLN